jgi:hypothetical protein
MPDDSRPSDLIPPSMHRPEPPEPGSTVGPPSSPAAPSDTLPEGPAGAAAGAPPRLETNSVDPGLRPWPPPAPPAPSDPSAATGPPWPRLVSSPGNGYRPPRLIRWPIVIGAILFAALIALFVVSAVSTPTSSPSATPYMLTASDAGFSARFPDKPQRIEKTVASGPVLLYISSLSDETVGVAFFRVNSASAFSLDGAIDGAATSLTNGKVVSRSTVTYHGQPAEDGVISFKGGIGNVRAVVIGSAAYLFEGFGSSASDFAPDYNTLLQTFTPTPPPASPPNGAPAAAALGAKIVPAPAGFSLFQDSSVPNGPLSAAGFDSFVASPGAAAQLHYSTGYQANYGDSQNGDVINVTLLEFASAGDATNFETAFTVSGVKTSRDPAVPEGETYDSTTASGGSYQHGVIATKNNRVMIVDYSSGSSARPALVDVLAAQQYTRI